MSAEFEPEFIDSNILIYAHDVSAGAKHTAAKELVQRLWETGSGCLSVQVLQEFYEIITRKVANPIPADMAAEIIRDLRYWHICTPTIDDVLGAIDLQHRYHTSFWDAMVIQTAACMDCRVLWSEDLANDQVYGGVQVKNPFIMS
ncbi:MAG: PIN domain-containing protein [Anaerolineaceae bacterium]|nr:PIN domain-containing protein [Anaerolineaceae bacterium]